MKFLKRYKFLWLLGVLSLLVYLFTRLVNLTALPIFTDEAIYLRWAQIAKNDANWRFISLTDGKQPLFVWLSMVAMKVIDDPLFAGRLVSVLTGLIGMISIYLLSKELFKREIIAWFSVLLFLLSPFSLFYQRLALMDGLLGSVVLLTLYLEVLLVRTLRLDVAMLLGMAMGASILTKTSGFFTLYLLPFSLLLFDFQQKTKSKKFLLWIALVVISAVMSQIIYSVLRLSPLFHMIAQKDTTFVYPVREWLTHPFTFFVGNFRGLFEWLILYSTWPVIILLILALFFSFRRYFRERWLLFVWFAFPFLLLALFGKVLYPRFIAFMVLPLLILASSFFWEITQKIRSFKFLTVLTFFLVLPLIIFDYQILFDITHAPLTTIDRGQYVNDWPAGWGVKETVEYLKPIAKKEKIAIYTDGTFGLLPYAVELYMVYDPNVTIVGVWPVPEQIPPEILKTSREKPTFFVLNQVKTIPSGWPFKELGKWQKGTNDQSFLRLFQIIPAENL
ncbi:glycosyltransferase family 39 protein [Candidatus Microgenomates bacterium]|nr:glycosyltransferase family 39 protein [Candidatus Microgenomates bacterium]